MKYLIRFIKSFYNERFEDFSVRLLYFFNTINTFYLMTGALSFVFIFRGEYRSLPLLIGALIGVILPQIADFHPLFTLFSFPLIALLTYGIGMSPGEVGLLLGACCLIFYIIQLMFMSIPESIVARNPIVILLKLYNSLYTVAPTTVSLTMSVYYSFFLAFSCGAAVSCQTSRDWFAFAAFSLVSLAAAYVTRLLLPRNHFSKFHKPDTPETPHFKRLLILNIDGTRLDIFNSLSLPAIARLKSEGSWHTTGLSTIYRALTNPAFASILTGTIPKVHGVRDNNFGQSILTEGLPDIVPSIAYGSMHVKHFCKSCWETKVVSLPEHSVYGADDIMVAELKEDIVNRRDIRLFLADFSEADFLGHAYGSTSRQYKDALRRIDGRIGELLDWLISSGNAEGLGIIVCSDHGIAAIDHSYLIARPERYVPFIVWGEGVKKNFALTRPGKIMDICCTAAYLLGVRYPYDARGQVFTEVLEGHDRDTETDEIVSRFNAIKYEAEESIAGLAHPEIYEGDLPWWEETVRSLPAPDGGLRVLDVGCGMGFVAERFISAGASVKEFICMDISPGSLQAARERLEGKGSFKFVNTLEEVKGEYDVITASSMLHHMRDPGILAGALQRLFAPGAYFIGSHEPDARAYRNPLFRLMATFYKSIGGGVSINEATVERFNEILRKKYPRSPRVCREEILQIVEYHSPVEQLDDAIPKGTGFDPEPFLKGLFPGWEIVKLESYSTAFYRKWSGGFLRSILSGILDILFKYRNLFRFVIRKAS